MHVDADAHHGKGNLAAFGLGFDKNPAHLATADEQIVGPAQVDSKPGGGANGIGSGEARGERQQVQSTGRHGRAQQDTCIESFAGGRAPGVFAAPASS